MFCVRVPVLSVHITVAQPRVSTDGRLRTIALCLDIRISPRASIMVTIAGSPSGIAATARETEVINISSGGIFLNVPMIKIIPHMTSAATPSALPVSASRFCSGVCGGVVSLSIEAILPTSVFIPVFTATARAVPPVMHVDDMSIFFISPGAVSG